MKVLYHRPAVANVDAQLHFLRMHGRAAPATRVNQCKEAARASQILPQALIFTRPSPRSHISYKLIFPQPFADLLRTVL
jgi:hypothetical protein